MIRSSRKMIALAVLALTVALALLLTPAPRTRAADHADSPLTAADQAADIGDVFVFLDPNDNTKVILIMTTHGFITPGESANFAFFDNTVRYRFEIENTGDAKPDTAINVTFSKRTSTTDPQTATIELPNGRTFTAPTTVPTEAAAPNPFVITTDSTSGVSFFAGESDDPFFFDIPAFSRFAASARAGSPDPSQLQRGRDTFAGYNIMTIALSLPVSLVKGTVNVIGVQGVTQRQVPRIISKEGDPAGFGRFVNIDRAATPGINVLVMPYALRNSFNASTPVDDANGKFASAIVSSLQSLGTNSANINVLANIAVVHGDYLRLDTTIANTGPSGGNNSGAGFPNGRRLADDVVKTFLFFVSNQTITTGDNLSGNDVPLQNTFPFVAPPQQPRAPGVIDDNTRN